MNLLYAQINCLISGITFKYIVAINKYASIIGEHFVAFTLLQLQ